MDETEPQTVDTGRAEPVGYVTLVRSNRNYRALWLGEIVSLFGDWFNLIASAALISSLTSSGIAVGGLFVVRMLAPFLVSPLAGVIADRFNRKSVLILADLTRAVVVLGFLLVRRPEHTWLLYALTAVQLGISGFFFPARNAILPDIVSSRELGPANALSSATWSTMLAFGAALGGLVAGELGVYPAFIVDAASFLVSAAMLWTIQYPAGGREEGIGDFSRSSRVTLSPLAVLGYYFDGLRYLKAHRDVLAVSLHKAAISITVNGAFQVVMVALAERVYPIGAGGGTSLGLLFAVSGVGTGVGPILARRFTGDREQPQRLTLALMYPLMAVGMVIIAGLPGFSMALFGAFLRAFAGGIIWVFSTQLLLNALPGQVRGRVFSTEFALFTLASAIGTAAGGWGLDNPALGLTGAMIWMAVLALVPGALWAWWLWRRGIERA